MSGGPPRDFPSDMFWRTHPPMPDDEADRAAARIRWGAAARPAAAIELRPNLSGMRIVDVGCGRGELVRAFGRLGATVVGVDLDADRIAEARAAATPFDGDVAFVIGDAALPLPMADADLAVCHYSGWGYGGAHALAATFAAVRDALSPGGAFVVETYDGDATIERFDSHLSYPAPTPEGEWTVVCGASMDAPRRPGEIGRIDQAWTHIDPSGVAHGPLRVAFEPMTVSAIAAVAACAGFAPPDDRTAGLHTRSTPGTPRRLMRFARPAAAPPGSVLASRMAEAWLAADAAGMPAVRDGVDLAGRDMLDAATRIEAALRMVARPDGHHSVVALLPRSWAWPATLAACRAAGLAFVPIDPDMPPDRLRGALTRIKPVAVVSFADHAADLHDRCYGGALPPIRVLRPGPSLEDLAVTPCGEGWDLPVAASHVVLTSGSTGIPKAVLLHEEGLLAVVDAQVALLPPPPGAFLWALGPAFDASLSDVLCATLGGRTLVVHRPALTRIGDLRRALANVDCADLPPSMVPLLADDVRTVPGVVFGGERASRAAIGILSGRRHGFQAYGPTEASVCAMVARPGAGWRPGTLGRPLIPGTVALVADGVARLVVAGGRDFDGVVLDPPADGPVEGEIVLLGEIVAHGYLDDEWLTSKRFGTTLGRPAHTTGDLARLEHGVLVWTGRLDRQFKANGVMVCPEEIEAAVAVLLPGSSSRVVVEDGRAVLHVAEAAPPDDLAQLVATRLGAAFRPAAVHAVDAIPIGANGKPDDDALRAMRP